MKRLERITMKKSFREIKRYIKLVKRTLDYQSCAVSSISMPTINREEDVFNQNDTP